MTTLSRTVLDSKAVLARLMATENLTVEHVPTASTAFFDTENRRLVFPCWKGMSSDLYDMLAGHETGHALFTPAGTAVLMDAMRRVDTRNGSAAAKTFLNIVEDARIERLMKARLPGLRRSFFNAYRELMDNPLFADCFQSIDQMRLIDRINIHYKWGAFVTVPFTAEELPVVQAVATTKTFDDVIDVAHRIWEMQREQENSEPQTQTQTEQGQPGEGQGQGEQDAAPQQSSSTRDPQKQTETSDSQSQDSKGDSKGEEKESSTGDTSKAKSAKGQGKPNSNANASQEQQTETEQTGDEGEPQREPTAAATDSIMQRASNQFRDEKAAYYTPLTLPAFDTKTGIIGFRSTVLPILGKWNTIANGAKYLSEWEQTSRRDVSVMQQEFLRRMAANAAARTSVSDTGTIDVNRLWSYKISDDIFLQNATVRNGQSHGIVIFVDFSGSMSGIMPETLRQMLMLAAWCRRSNIPCDVYGFSDGMGTEWQGKDSKGYALSPWKHRDSDANRASLDTGMRLIHLISTKGLSERDWRITAGGLLAAFDRANNYEARYNQSGVWGTEQEYRKIMRLFSLNSTPTVAATAAALTVVEEFKRQHGLEIVHFVTLTDGQASDRIYAEGKPTGKTTSWGAAEIGDVKTNYAGYNTAGYCITDPATGFSVKCRSGQELQGINALLRQRVAGLNSVGISITSKRDFKGMLRWSSMTEEQQAKCMEQSKSDGFLTAPGVHGYTVWFGVPCPKLDEVDYFDSVSDDSTKATLTKAFAKTLEKQQGNRLLCTRLVDLMAKPATQKKGKVTA